MTTIIILAVLGIARRRTRIHRKAEVVAVQPAKFAGCFQPPEGSGGNV